jgi:Fe-Mn family superoxide dismutase
MVYELPDLPYEYDSLEPAIDAKTLEIHHSKHHKGYVDKLNAALEKYPELADKKIEELLIDIGKMPEDLKIAVKNNGGGHAAHSLFWQVLSSEKQKPEGRILEKINEDFGSFDEFAKKFKETATKHFASGWVWLVVNDGKLEIMETMNHDYPMSEGKTPVLVVDVWEHAYYLKYQNRRAEYVDAVFEIISWKKVDELLKDALKS